jgi:hypothetical protein
MRNYLQYQRARLFKAALDFQGFGKDHLKSSGAALAGAAIALGWLAPKGDAMTEQIAQTVAGCIIGPLGVAGLVFLIFWFLAPSRIYAKQQEEISAHKSKACLDKPSLSKWIELDPLQLGQIAFLWCDREPDGSVEKAVGEVNFAYEKLRRALLKKKLSPSLKGMEAAVFEIEIQGFRDTSPNSINPISETLPISVAELRRYAEAIGEKPLFLFPDAAKPNKLVTESALKLAGLVRFLSERAERYGFTFAQNDGAFLTNYKALEESVDPVWVDNRINQLRRDFLQYCAAVGDANEQRDFDEGEKLRAELRRLRNMLMAELAGMPTA